MNAKAGQCLDNIDRVGVEVISLGYSLVAWESKVI